MSNLFAAVPYCPHCQTPDYTEYIKNVKFRTIKSEIDVTYQIEYTMCNKCDTEWFQPEQFKNNINRKEKALVSAIEMSKVTKWLDYKV